MINLAVAIRHNLQALGRFTGRDTPSHFWPYVGFVFAYLVVSTFVMTVPTFAQAMTASGPAGVDADPAIFDVRAILYPFMAALIMGVLLLAASVVRRLHDRNASGLWGALPLPFLAVGLGLLPGIVEGFVGAGQPNVGQFFILFFDNVIFLMSLLWLAILLACPGTAGPNRFGGDPAQDSTSRA